MVHPAGFEPATNGLEVRCSIQTELRVLVPSIIYTVARGGAAVKERLSKSCFLELAFFIKPIDIFYTFASEKLHTAKTGL